MENAKELAHRFQEVMLDGKWIANTNFQDQLSQTTFEQATQKIGELNTILALTYHVDYYIAGLNNFFEKGQLEIRDKYSFDHPEIKNQADWDQLRMSLMNDSKVFVNHVANLSPDQLEAVFVDPKYGTYRRNIEGMIEHAYYHLGQVVLLKKLLTSQGA